MRPCLFTGRPGISSWRDEPRNIAWCILRRNPSLSKRCARHHLVTRSWEPAVRGLLQMSTLCWSHTICRMLLIVSQAIVHTRKDQTAIRERVQKLSAGLASIHAIQVDQVCRLNIFLKPTCVRRIHCSDIHSPKILGEIFQSTIVVFGLSMSCMPLRIQLPM